MTRLTRPSVTRLAAAVALVAVIGSFAPHERRVEAAVASFVAGSVCLSGTAPGDLSRLFDDEPGGVVGADYQRATTMPDGRVLWTFQDAAVRVGPNDIRIVHNIAVIQDGRCFSVRYRGSRTAPQPMFFADRTVPFERWYWPLDTAVGDDGRVYVFTAELEERGDRYLTHSVPIGTWVAVFDPVTDSVVGERRAPDGSADLYGWSATSDETWTYLYAHCYRQFGFDLYIFTAAFDRSCSTEITVARVPKGEPLAAPVYWDGERWQPDPARAVSVVADAGHRINANQIEWTGAQFVSVNKEGDWWGDTIELSRSPSATGPFEIYDVIAAPLRCPASECNSFFADWVPAAAVARPQGGFVVSLAHNRWDGVVTSLYRPSMFEVRAPSFLPGGRRFAIDVGVGVVTALNVAVVGPASPGFVTVYPCAGGLPNASNVNVVNEPVVANLVLARADADGRICVYSSTTTDVVIDRAGSFGADSGFVPVDRPVRLVDTREGLGAPRRRVAAGGDLVVDVGGSEAVALNVVAVDPSQPGFLTVYACDRPVPGTSNVNHVGEPVVANLAIVRPSADGTVCIRSLAETDVVVDLAGQFDETVDGAGFDALDDAVRLADTRAAGRVPAGGTIRVRLPDTRPGVLNLTAVDPSAPGFLSVHPCDVPVPNASNVNYVHVPVVANLVIARPAADGSVCVYSSAETDVVVDMTGSLGPASRYVPLESPRRLVDSRTGLGIPGELGVR